MDLAVVAAKFRFSGRLSQIAVFGNGHIHDTHVVSCIQADGTTRRYILQRINCYVFKNPVALMENIERVTYHLNQKIQAAGGDPARETLNLVPTVDGGSFFEDNDSECWRAFLFIEGARTYETAENRQQLYQTAWAFGNFQRQLADFPAVQLHETIPNFHHTPMRFQAFMEAVERDSYNRAAAIQPEIRFLQQREPETRVLAELIRQGALPLRVTHNDTKLNNVMIDDQTGKAICVLDLDTVMPGLSLYDFGDAVRSAAALVEEDSQQSSAAGISLDTFDSLAHGYLDSARSFLLDAEMELLAFSARLITLEQAIRFLGDYLNGDIYYKVNRPGHNLDRARTQIGMLADMEDKFEKMTSIVSKYR
jgi:Ser/Thr protein kinase RdoA (MazF antagonist)